MNKLSLFTAALVAALLGIAGFLAYKEVGKGKPTVTTESKAERENSMRAAFSPSADSAGDNEISTDPELLAELQPFFIELESAFTGGDPERLEKVFSSKSTFAYCEASGLIDWGDMPSPERAKFRKNFTSLLRDGLAKDRRTSNFSKLEVLRIEVIREGELIAYVKSYYNEFDPCSRIRWWLLRNREGDWQAYDYENLDQGLRLTSLLGTGLSPNGQVPAWLKDFTSLLTAIPDMRTDNFDDAFAEVRRTTEELLKHTLPQDAQGFVLSMRANVLLEDDDIPGALALLDRAEKFNRGAPVLKFQRGECHRASEDYPNAIKEYENYVEILGWDADVHDMVADCYFHLGDLAKSLDHAQRGLADHPQSSGCLAKLVLSLPQEQIRDQLTERLKHFEDKEGAYEIVIDYAIEEGVVGARSIAIAMLKEDFPDSDLIDYYESEDQDDEGEPIGEPCS